MIIGRIVESNVDLSIIGKKTKPAVFEYTWKDVALYALGVGATTNELPFIYERWPGGMKVLPSFCIVPASIAFPNVGDNIDISRFLFGEQMIRLYRPIPFEGRIIVVGEVTDIFDKGKGAAFHCKATGHTEQGEHIFDCIWVIFYVGHGGFGGDPGPKAELIRPPEGIVPDYSISQRVASNQAALYRLNGDLNPLHLDPAFAKGGGFDRPILHGLCTYGFAVRAIINGLLDGDVSRLKAFKARFSSQVYMGDTLTTRCWQGDGRLIVQVRTEKALVISNAYAEIE
jgi:acyl dehydratase